MGNRHEPAFLRPREVGVILGVSGSRIYQLVRDGQLRSTRLGTRVLIPAGEVTRFAEGLTNSALSDTHVP